MKFAGSEILSRSTITSGRTLMIVCGTSLLVHYLEVDISGLTIVGVNPSEIEIQTASLWVIAFLWLALLINWASDLVGLGLYNRAETEKSVPSLYGGSSRLVNRLSSDLSNIDGKLEQDEPIRTQIVAFNKNMDDLRVSLTQYRRVLYFYFFFYSFILPTTLALFAAIKICQEN